jgi:hypothetical protein
LFSTFGRSEGEYGILDFEVEIPFNELSPKLRLTFVVLVSDDPTDWQRITGLANPYLEIDLIIPEGQMIA